MRKNNERILQQIFNDHGRELLNFAYNRTRSQATAEDIVQNAYVRIVECKRDLNVNNARSFAFTIILNLLRDMSRRNATRLAKHSYHIDTIDYADEPTPKALTYPVDPSTPIEAIEHIQALNRHLVEHLPKPTLKAFYMHRIQGLTHKQISKRMDVTVSMIEKHCMQAIKEVKRFRAKHNI